MVEYVTDDHYTVQLRDDYWNKDQEFFVDEWTVRYFPDISTMCIELEKEEFGHYRKAIYD